MYTVSLPPQALSVCSSLYLECPSFPYFTLLNPLRTQLKSWSPEDFSDIPDVKVYVCVCVCVCVCAEFKEKGYTFFGITSLMLDQFDCWCFLS